MEQKELRLCRGIGGAAWDLRDGKLVIKRAPLRGNDYNGRVEFVTIGRGPKVEFPIPGAQMTSRIDSKSVAFVLCFAGVIVLAGVAALGQEEPKRSNEGVARTGKGENHPAIAKPVSIAMDSIYTTNDQDSVKHVRRRDKDDLDAIYRETNGVGASNLFLVRGKDIAGAVFYTRSVFTRSVSVDVLSRPADCKQVWLVAYFGVAGSGSAWIVKSVEKREKAAIRLVYERGESDLNDIHQYFAWAPLGDLAPGSYSLEMFDAKEKQVTLMRRVTVKINADE